MIKVGDRVQITGEARDTFVKSFPSLRIPRCPGTVVKIIPKWNAISVDWDDLTSEVWSIDSVEATEPELPSFWILWQPGYPAPPTTKFTTYDEAVRVGTNMANKNAGKPFFVCEMKARIEAEVTPVRIKQAG